jgi:hypothetical protein
MEEYLWRYLWGESERAGRRDAGMIELEESTEHRRMEEDADFLLGADASCGEGSTNDCKE